MLTPGTVIAWGGEWNRHQRRYARPLVECAVDLAQYGLSDLGIQPIAEKRVRVRRVGRTCKKLGKVAGRWVELNFNSEDVKRKRCTGRLADLSMTTLHEFTHRERAARVTDTDSLIDLAVDEGIAYTAEALFARSALLGEEYIDYLNVISQMHPITLANLTTLLVRDSDYDMNRGGSEYALYDKWFTNIDNSFEGPLGAVVGLCYVQRLLGNGLTLSEILALETSDFMQNACPGQYP